MAEYMCDSNQEPKYDCLASNAKSRIWSGTMKQLLGNLERCITEGMTPGQAAEFRKKLAEEDKHQADIDETRRKEFGRHYDKIKDIRMTI